MAFEFRAPAGTATAGERLRSALRPVGLASLASVCLAGLLPPGAAARLRASCVVPGAKILVHHDGATVFDLAVPHRTRAQRYTETAAFGCLSRGGRRVFLGLDDDNLGAHLLLPVVAGRFAAAALTSCDGAGTLCSATIVVWNLVTGRRTARVTPSAALVAGSVRLRLVGSLVLSPGGSIAWIATDVLRGTASAEVHALDAGGSRLVDSGPAIDVRSLRLNSWRLTWTRDGTQHVATLG